MTTSDKLSKEDISSKVDSSIYKSLTSNFTYFTTTRLDILYVVSVFSRFMHFLREKHYIATKRVLRYIKWIVVFGVMYSKSTENKIELLGYFDNDWGGTVNVSRSTS